MLLIHGADLCVDVTVYGILTGISGINPAEYRIIYLTRMTVITRIPSSRRSGIQCIIRFRKLCNRSIVFQLFVRICGVIRGNRIFRRLII